jgi:NTP pyrophosphatase (non-canonical NTP hydrolase)
MELSQFQDVLRRTFAERDARRGTDGTFRRLVEEVGELAKALRTGDPAELAHEVGDVLAWLTSVATITGVDLAGAAARYAQGCPRCGALPCRCSFP